MTKRPSVMSLDDLMRPDVTPEPEPAIVEPPALEQPPEAAAAPPEPVPASEAAPAEGQDAPAAVEPPPAKPKAPPAFRTSVYFHREVHDVLRDIAYRERKNISDLINEGLDHVLTSRNYPTTGQLRKSAKI